VQRRSRRGRSMLTRVSHLRHACSHGSKVLPERLQPQRPDDELVAVVAELGLPHARAEEPVAACGRLGILVAAVLIAAKRSLISASLSMYPTAPAARALLICS
jgi:hypothetical protein